VRIGHRKTLRALTAVWLLLGLPRPALHAQTPDKSSAAIEVAVTTQGTIPLAGASVVLNDQSGRQLEDRVSDEAGHARFADVPPGRYRVTASLSGFQTTTGAATVEPDVASSLAIDLPVAGVSESVDVVAHANAVETIGTSDAVTGQTVAQYGGPEGLGAMLQLLASVITVKGDAVIKGGRPSQSGMQIGSSTLVDPSTGFVHFRFPADAIDSVSVLPNPYAVEYGRFSSGLVVIQTRRAPLDKWKTVVGDLDPSLRNKRNEPLHYTGLESIGPWLETGGPLIDGRLFVEQSLQFRYESDDVPSRPENERVVTNWLSTFTRADLRLSPTHSLAATLGYFPSTQQNGTLGTFTPPNATVQRDTRAGNGAVTWRSVWSTSVVGESTLQIQQFSIGVSPYGQSLMELWPDTTLGHFFNVQQRDTATVQWIQTVSGTHEGWGGLHALKVGVDLLHTDYAGSSVSSPVLIRDATGLLVRRIDFVGPTVQSVQSTDVAVFAQDRLQLRSRWLLEFGARLDRDGIVERVNATPRVGTVVLLDEDGSTQVRGGYGLFYERMPSVAGAFTQFQSEVDTRYGPDGVTPVAPPITYVQRAEIGPSAPHSATWDVAFEHRFNKTWTAHVSYLDRRGSGELIVQPITANGTGEMLLDSLGRSVYRDVETGVKFTKREADVTLTYVWSQARSDLNSLTNFYDTIMWPIIGANAYAPSSTNVPHRLFGRGRYQPTDRWLITGVVDWRTGFPYSAVDASLEFMGPRNTLYQFPARFKADLGIERHFVSWKWKPWMGVRVYNAFKSFMPTDVQANLSSPNFGSFYNSELRQLRLEARFER
jgi:hypothetical protein